jgi:predicted PurR-regulated permease PerM
MGAGKDACAPRQETFFPFMPVDRQTTSAELRSRVLQIILVVIAAAILLWLLYALRKIILLLVFTTLFCYLIAPLVDLLTGPRRLWFITWRVPRALAIFGVYTLLFYGVFMAVDWLVPLLSDQISSFITSAPEYAKQVDRYSRMLTGLPARYRLPVRWQQEFTDWINAALTSAGDWLQSVALRLLELGLYSHWLILIPVIGFFFLKDGRSLRQRFLASLPKADVRVRVADFLQDVSETLAAYIRTQLLACLLIGVVVGTGLRLLGVSYSLVLGVAAGLLEFIPVVGPAALGVIAAVVAGFHSLRSMVTVIIFIALLRLIYDYVIYPRLIGRSIEMHPVLVILAVLCGVELGGITGVFLSVPVMALLLVCLRHWRDLQAEQTVIKPQPVITDEFELLRSGAED